LGCSPIKEARELGSERRETVRSLSAVGAGNLKSLTSVFGMGTGVSSSLLPPDILKGRNPQNCIGKFLGQDLDLLVSLS
jgi:hypothetical protein